MNALKRKRGHEKDFYDCCLLFCFVVIIMIIALVVFPVLKLVNEAPRASCVECDRSLIPGSSSGSTSPTSDTEFNNNVMSSLSSLILTNGSSSSSSSNNGCAKASSHSSTSPHSGLQVGTSTSSTNTMETSNNCWDQLDLSNPFGKAFHGYLSHSQTLQLLTSDGQYLVRKQEDSEDEFVLSVRYVYFSV